MPPSLRRRPQHHQLSPPPPEPFADSDDDIVEEELDPEQDEGDVLGDEGLEMEGEEEDEDDEDDEPLVSPSHPHSIHHDPPPPHLREISTLASWTVSSSKPGCSIPQLRHPSTSLFWQSDGPQPHYLNIHFFKLVRIVGLRLYLDFEQDESYTPTRIIFLAGSGMNDLQEWGEMRLESPKGWVWADFSGVGEAESESDNEDDDEDCEPGDNDATDDERTRPGARDATRSGYESDFENTIPRDQTTGRPPAPEAMQVDPQATPQQQPQTSPTATPQQTTPTLNRPTPRLPFASLSANTPTQTPRSNRRNKRPKMPVLRAHLVQIKILENHQNGKDTHLRGLQIFARDDEKEAALRKAEGGGGVGVGLGIGKGDERNGRRRRVGKGRGLGGGFKGIGRSEWDVEPSIR